MQCCIENHFQIWQKVDEGSDHQLLGEPPLPKDSSNKMVKFGRHVEFFLKSEGKDGTSYVVPYNSLKDIRDSDAFVAEWKLNLRKASDSFDDDMEKLWKQVFAGIRHLKDARGAVPDLALQLYILSCYNSKSDNAVDESGMVLLELLANVKRIHSTALINAEALRKLAKKFDKQVSSEEDSLSPILLPKLYASNFVVGQSLLESGMVLIREQLELLQIDTEASSRKEAFDASSLPGLADDASDGASAGAGNLVMDAKEKGDDDDDDDDDDDMEGSTSSTFLNKKQFDRKNSGSPVPPEIVHASRLDEFDWLKRMVQSCAPEEISHIVAHRGFHCINDKDDKRPLENSQTAYEAAWTSGISLCECDIALTRDEKLVLAHDEDFTRLALDPRSEICKMNVSDLTFKEIMSLPLKSGTRPPLLIDVLRSAHAIGEHAKLIVEIKPGNAEAGTALARMFLRHPKLMAHCAVVMSFDLYALHNLRKELHSAVAATHYASNPCNSPNNVEVVPLGSVAPIPGRNISFNSSMSLGNFAVIRPNPLITATTSASPLPPLGHRKMPSFTTPDKPPAKFGYKHRKGSSDYFGVGLPMSQSDLGAAHAVMQSNLGTTPDVSSHIPPRSDHDLKDAEQQNNRRPRSASFAFSHTLPKIMLLTVAEAPKKPCELYLDIMGDELHRVDEWLKVEDYSSAAVGVSLGIGNESPSHMSSLDGIYLQYQSSMMTNDGAARLRELASKYDVGVWGDKKTPDDFKTFHWLVRQGRCSYVNSDLPRAFKKKSSPVMHRGETLPL